MRVGALDPTDIDTLAEINANFSDGTILIDTTDSRLSDARVPTAHNHAASEITSGTIATARLGSGTANSTTFLRGDQTYAPPAGGSPGGSSGQVQYNNAGAFGGTTAIVYAGSGTHLTVTAQTASDVPIRAKLAASPTGNAIAVDSNGGSGGDLFRVTKDGYVKTVQVGHPTESDLDLRAGTTSSTAVAISQNGFTYFRLQPNIGIVISISRQFIWSASSFNLGTGGGDTGLARDSAGVVRVTNGSTGTGILKCSKIISTLETPASASEAGVAGTILADANFIYVCTATNTWKRVAIATW